MSTDAPPLPRLPTMYAKRPRCSGCNSLNLVPYRTIQRSTGSKWRYVKCADCRRRGILILT